MCFLGFEMWPARRDALFMMFVAIPVVPAPHESFTLQTSKDERHDYGHKGRDRPVGSETGKPDEVDLTPPKRTKGSVDRLTAEEIDRLLAAAYEKSARQGLMLRTLLETGMRVSLGAVSRRGVGRHRLALSSMNGP